MKAAVRAGFLLRNKLRQKMRTDLLALCHLIGYNDVSRKVHGPILDALQKFPGGEEKELRVRGQTVGWEYSPSIPLWQLTGKRQKLLLYPRGHLKTTVITQAHAIQWIINYPDIRILLSCFTGDQVEKVIRAVKGVFQFSEEFRVLFPEFCPPKEKSADWGSKDQFITPARKLVRGEPTMFSVTVGKTIAGYHPDVIFHSDLVDKENVKTPGGIAEVHSHFKYMNPLLERFDARDGFPASRGWVYVEGTPYDYGDLHNSMMKSVGDDWDKVVESADPQDRADKKPLWETRFPPQELENLRHEMGDWLYSAQYRMKCIPQADGLCDPRDLIFIERAVINQLLPRLRLHATVDLHGMEQGNRNDYTAMTLAGFDRDGRMYVVEMKVGRFTPEEVIQHIFDWHARYPQIIDYKVEKDAHARVLLPFLQREMSKRQRFPFVVAIPRDTHTSKKHRIRGLRPWFKSGIIVFPNDLSGFIKTELADEVAQFPSESSGVHDDILDTLADQMQNRDGELNMDVVSDGPDMTEAQFGKQKTPNRFTGFNDQGVAQWLYGNDPDTSVANHMTGFLN